MAKVLFFLQLIVALVVLPLWPGLDTQYTSWGLVYLAFVLALPAAAVLAVYGPRTGAQAWFDAWSTTKLGRRSDRSPACWALVLDTLPAGALLGGLVALIGALGHLDPAKPLPVQALVLVFFCLVWGFLGLLLGRVFQEVVVRLARQSPGSLLVLTPAIAGRFGLTPREVQAAQAVLDGATYKDAAKKLFVSPSTVKSHVLSVYQKTGAGNKIELLRMVEAQSDLIHQSVDGGSSEPGRS
jgi:DNA-binding CsgD family transcriptional regulator